MNVITPMRWYTTWLNKLFFFATAWAPRLTFGRWNLAKGLITLSLIHYARWVVLHPRQFPHLGGDQPRERLRYSYMLFFSNFNGSWDQYIDSFSAAISGGLDMFWIKTIQYPKSVPLEPFHRYITANQIWTDHYYNAYPIASSNDVKSAKKVRDTLLPFIQDTQNDSPEAFERKYNAMMLELQNDISLMNPTPVVSLSAAAVAERLRAERPAASR